MVNTDQIIILGDFHMHVDSEGDRLNVAFEASFDSIGFIWRIHFRRADIWHEEIAEVPHNPAVWPVLLTFHFIFTEHSKLERKCHYQIFIRQSFKNLQGISCMFCFL